MTKKLTQLRKEYENKINSLEFIKEYSPRVKVSSAIDIVKQSGDYKDLDKEVFVVYFLDTKNKIMKREIISMGILDASIIHPREVFRGAILFSASKIILSHNHPSGDCTPSNEDIQITKKLKEAGEMVGIAVIDHVIIGSENKYWSAAEEGII